MYKIPVALMRSLEEYLVRCGVSEPFEKIYVKNALELVSADMGRVMAIVLISQLTKLQICLSTGENIFSSLDLYLVSLYFSFHKVHLFLRQVF